MQRHLMIWSLPSYRTGKCVPPCWGGDAALTDLQCSMYNAYRSIKMKHHHMADAHNLKKEELLHGAYPHHQQPVTDIEAATTRDQALSDPVQAESSCDHHGDEHVHYR